MSGEFHDRRVLVTGGSMGIGLAVARELSRRGATVILAARRHARLAQALEALTGHGHQAVDLDVSDHVAWPDAMAQIDAGGALHGLVAAAGVLGPIGPIEEADPHALSAAIGVNLIGTMLALHHAIPRLRSAAGRAVTFSGGGAAIPLPRYDSYAASKAGVVRLTENLAAGSSVEVNCVAPGFVATAIHEETLKAGPEAAGDEYHARTLEQLRSGGFPAQEAAELACFLLSSEADGISGRLLSARWDPWRTDSFREQLRRDPELGVLRRVDGVLFGRIPDGERG